MYSERIEETLKRRGISTGDEIKLTSKKGSFEGILIPRPDVGDKGVIVIKLKSGYNIGIKFDDKTRLEKIASRRETFSFPRVKMKENKDLPNVTMLYTGGTIGSKVDYQTGGVDMRTKPEELLYTIPELSNIANIEIRNLMSISSEDVTYKEWQRIANETADALNKGAKGVVIAHGTDTMHFTSAALSFMLGDLNAPVVITGSQRSSDRGSSDAFTNLVCSTHVASRSDIAEVGICMHANSSDTFCNFIRGTKVRKMHTSRRDAFRPINNRPIAKVGVDGSIEYVSGYNKEKTGKRKVRAMVGYEPKVALVKFYPNSNPEIMDHYMSKGYRGLIIEGTGLGHVAVAPSNEKYAWLEHIKRATDSGMIVGVTSQCLNGRVNANVYSNGRLISGAGAIYCEDMLPEVALVKLGFLLGNYNREKSVSLLSTNISGEITERTEIDWYP